MTIVAPVSLIICGVLSRPEMMFLGTAALLVLITAGVLCSRPVAAMA